MEPRINLRLLQISSPAFPVGAFNYSQGLEWAVEKAWVNNPETLGEWLGDIMQYSLAYIDIPLLKRLYNGWQRDDKAEILIWSDFLLACKETSELRDEERNKGRALMKILSALEVKRGSESIGHEQTTYLGAYALAATEWNIKIQDAAAAYVWGWLENQVSAAIKLIPIGQQAGQRVLDNLITEIEQSVDVGLGLSDEEIGASLPGYVMASALHEQQYTRLFRS